MTYVVVFGASLTNLAGGILEPTVAPYLEILGLSYDMIGFILSARFIMVALLSIPFALFGAVIGVKKLLYLNGFVFLLAGLSLVFISGSYGIFIFFFFLGLTSAIFSGPGIAIIANNEPNKRITAFALFSATWMIPLALGALFSAFWFINTKIYTVTGLSSIFYPTSIFLLIGSFIFILLLFSTKSTKIYRNQISNTKVKKFPQEKMSVKKQLAILFTPVTLIPLSFLFLSEFFSGAGAGSTLPFLSPYLKSLGASPFQLSILVFILWTIGGLMTQLTAPLSKRFGDLNLYIFTTILSVTSLLGIVFSNELLLSATFFIFRGVFANMIAPVAQNRMVGYIHEEVRAVGLAISGTSRWIGWSLFSPISGKIIDLFGYNISFTFTSVIYIIALLLFVRTVKKYRALASSS
jgi:MFS family permease